MTTILHTIVLRDLLRGPSRSVWFVLFVRRQKFLGIGDALVSPVGNLIVCTFDSYWFRDEVLHVYLLKRSELLFFAFA